MRVSKTEGKQLNSRSSSLNCSVSVKMCCLPLSPPAGGVEKYMNGKWQKIPPEDNLKMTKLDGQVWLALYNLLLKEDCQRKYDFNNFNKNQLLKVMFAWTLRLFWIFLLRSLFVFLQSIKSSSPYCIVTVYWSSGSVWMPDHCPLTSYRLLEDAFSKACFDWDVSSYYAFSHPLPVT